jgi:hypothetical protein
VERSGSHTVAVDAPTIRLSLGLVAERRDVVRRGAGNELDIGIDAHERGFAVDGELDRLLAGLDLPLFQCDHVGCGKLELCRIGGEQSNVNQLIEGDLRLLPVAGSFELLGAHLDANAPFAVRRLGRL